MKETMANQQPPPDTDSDVTNVDVEEKITNTNRIEEPFKKSENDVENIRVTLFCAKFLQVVHNSIF